MLNAWKNTEMSFLFCMRNLTDNFRILLQWKENSNSSLLSFTVDVECVSEETKMELLDLQCYSLVKKKYNKVGVLEFYKFPPSEKYPLLFDFSLRILAMLGSTYVCEQFFNQ